MASYKYQQNCYDGSAYGYVKYNITPDFGTPIAPGETVTITGEAYRRDLAIKSIAVNSSASGTYRRSYINVNISKGRAGTFTITFPMWELGTQWGSGRLKNAQIDFVLCHVADLNDSSDVTTKVTAQTISYLQYRVIVAKRQAEFERYSQVGGIYQKDDEGTSVMGKLSLSISEEYSASDITVATVKVTNNSSGGTQTLNISSNVLSTALSQNGYVESSPSLFSSIEFDTAYNYTLQFTIGDAYNTCVFSVLVARAFANVHLSGCTTGGVAFGKFSTATEGHPSFECEYPAHFYGGIDNFHAVDEKVTCSGSSSLAYRGLSITIPANSYVCLTCHPGWNNVKPTAGGLATSSSSFNSYCRTYAMATVSGEGYPFATVTEYITQETTYYAWGKWTGSDSSTSIMVVGFYIHFPIE